MLEEKSKAEIEQNFPSRVAVLIPAFNANDKLIRTLKSIWAQDTPCEIFVIDDGSDIPIKITVPDSAHKTHVIRLNRNQGIVNALNVGLETILDAGFDYIARQDAGDIDLSHRLERQSQFLDANPGVNLVGSSVDFIDGGGNIKFSFTAVTGEGNLQNRMRYSPAFIHPSIMMRASALRDIGFYSHKAPHAEDYDLFFRLARHGGVNNIRETLVVTEYDPHGISMGKRRSSLASRLMLQIRYFDLRNLHSFLGVVQTCVLLCLPYEIVVQLKTHLSQVPIDTKMNIPGPANSL